MVILFMHHIDCSFLFLFSFFCALTMSDAVCPWVFFVFSSLPLFYLSYSNLSIMVRKTKAHRKSTSSSTPSFDSERFLSEKN